MKKKRKLYMIIQIVMLLLMIVSIICATTVTGSGFLDLSNIGRYIFIGYAIFCGIVSFIAFRIAKKS